MSVGNFTVRQLDQNDFDSALALYRAHDRIMGMRRPEEQDTDFVEPSLFEPRSAGTNSNWCVRFAGKAELHVGYGILEIDAQLDIDATSDAKAGASDAF